MYERKLCINASELGNNGKVRPTSFINLIQDTESLHIDSLTQFNSYINEHKLGIFLTFRQVDIHAFPTFKTPIKIETRPYEMNSFFGYRNTIIYDDKDNLIVSSYALGNFVDLKTNRSTRLPEEVYNFKLSNPFDMEYTKRKVFLPEDAKLILESNIEILRSHIDYYHHVNNMYYVEFGFNSLPDDFSFNRIRVEYKMPATYKDVIKIEMYTKDTTCWAVIKKEETICALVEFSTFKK